MRTTASLVLLLAAGGLFPPLHAQAPVKSDPARWEKAIADFEKQDQEKPPPQNAILFVGSSTIRRWDLAKSFPGMEVINRGFGGSQIADSVHFAPRIVTKHKPRLVVFYAGDNDLAAGKSPEQVAADFQAFVQIVHKDLPKTRILFLSIKPSLARWKNVENIRKANGLIAAYCKQHDGLMFLDLFPPMLGDDGKPRPELFVKDGLHLSEQGYELWTKLLQPYLK